MKPPIWTLIVIGILFCGIPAAWWTGKQSGVEEGMKAGAWHGNVNTLAMILGSRELEEDGDIEGSRKRLDDAIYLNASSLEMNQDSTVLAEYNRVAGEEMLMHVAGYYWRHPETYDIEGASESEPPSDPLEAAVMEAAEPLFEVAREHQRRMRGILLRYKPPSAESGRRRVLTSAPHTTGHTDP